MYSKSAKYSKSLRELFDTKNVVVSDSNVKQSSEETKTKKKNNDYPSFKYQDLGKDLNDQQCSDAANSIRKIDGTGQSVPVLIAVKGLKLPHVSETFRYAQPDIRSGPDLSMYKRLKNAGLDRYAEPTTKLFRSNGTKRGLLTRLSQQLVTKTHSSTSTDMFRKVAKKLPVSKVLNWDPISIDHVCFQNMNTKANAGFPYNFLGDKQNLPTIVDNTNLVLEYSVPGVENVPLSDKTIPIFEHAFYWTQKLVKLVDDSQSVSECVSNVAAFFRDHPDLNTFMLKRKDEKMDREEFLTKVRPYGSQPLPTRLFCMWAISVLEQNMLNFIDDPESISAYHFSPFYGGANRIIEYFEYHYKNNRKFCGISYGDDQLWMIRLHDGSVIFLNPDVKAMDMNTQSDTVSLISKVVKFNFRNIPPLHFKALVSALTMAFNHQFHLSGSFVFAKMQSLLSGIPGTTIINIHNSARIQVAVEESIEREKEPITVHNIFKVLGRAFGVVKNELGYTFKGYEGLSIEAANKSSDAMWAKHNKGLFSTNIENLRATGIPLAFLSNVIQIIEGKPVCVPADIHKLGASLVLPGNSPEKKTVQLQMERLVGVAFSGGWSDKEFLNFLTTTYDALSLVEKDVDMAFSELSPNIEQDVREILEVFNSDKDNPRLKRIPSYEFFLDMNTLSKEDFAVKYSSKHELGEPKSAVSVSTSSSKSSKDEVFSSSTMLEMKPILEELDNLDFSDEAPVPVDPKKAGNYNALNKEEEKEKKIKLQIRWEKKKARRFVNSLSVDDTTKSKMYQMIDNLEDDEDPYEYFGDYIQRDQWEDENDREYESSEPLEEEDEEEFFGDDLVDDHLEDDVVIDDSQSLKELEDELLELVSEKSNYNDSMERTRLHK